MYRMKSDFGKSRLKQIEVYQFMVIHNDENFAPSNFETDDKTLSHQSVR